MRQLCTHTKSYANAIRVFRMMQFHTHQQLTSIVKFLKLNCCIILSLHDGIGGDSAMATTVERTTPLSPSVRVYRDQRPTLRHGGAAYNVEMCNLTDGRKRVDGSSGH